MRKIDDRLNIDVHEMNAQVHTQDLGELCALPEKLDSRSQGHTMLEDAKCHVVQACDVDLALAALQYGTDGENTKGDLEWNIQ